MNWQDAALAMAGVIGSCVAIVHGILTRRHMVRPIEALFLTNLADGGRQPLCPQSVKVVDSSQLP